MGYDYEQENNDKNDIFTTLEFNSKLLKELTINLVPISKFLSISEGSTYCPFHLDVSHKSAKVYADVDGISRLYCYGQCQRQYTSYDYIYKILRRKPINYLLTEYPIQRLLQFINDYKESPVIDNVKTDYVKKKY